MTDEEAEIEAASVLKLWWSKMSEERKNEMALLEEQVYAGLRRAIEMGFIAGYRIAKTSSVIA